MSILTALSPAGIMGTVYKWLAIAGIGMGLAIGGFFYGRHYGDEQAKVTIDNYKTQIDGLDIKLANAFQPQELQVVTKYVTQTIHDTQVGVDNGKTIQTQVKNVPPVSNIADDVDKFLSVGWVSTYNAITADTAVASSTAANAAPSTFTAIDALYTDSINYATCKQYSETIDALRTIIIDYNNDIAAINAKNKKQ